MAHQGSSWIRRRAEQAVKSGLLRAYRGVGVDPHRYLNHLRRAYGLRITSFREMHTVPLPVVNYLADRVVRASTKMAMLEGAGAGLGGMISVLPDVGILGGITWRMIQKLSLVYGFEYATEDDMADLWLAAASAAGVDMGKDLVRKQVIEKFVPRIIERIAAQAAGARIRHGRHAQLLLCSRLGTPRPTPFSRAARLAEESPDAPALLGSHDERAPLAGVTQDRKR